MVEALSAYNIILGRPALSDFQAIALLYYQNIKFTMENEVGEVRGDQQATRKYYEEIIWEQKKNFRELPRLDHQGGHVHEIYTVQEDVSSFNLKQATE